MNNDRLIIIKGISAGVTFGIMWQLYLMLNMLFDSGLVLLGVPIVTMFLLSKVLAHVKVKYILLEILIGILPAIISASFMLDLGVVDWSFHQRFGEETEMYIGEGFVMLVETMIYLFLALFVPFIAYVIGRKQRKID